MNTKRSARAVASTSSAIASAASGVTKPKGKGKAKARPDTVDSSGEEVENNKKTDPTVYTISKINEKYQETLRNKMYKKTEEHMKGLKSIKNAQMDKNEKKKLVEQRVRSLNEVIRKNRSRLIPLTQDQTENLHFNTISGKSLRFK